jgi:hypothetical protein
MPAKQAGENRICAEQWRHAATSLDSTVAVFEEVAVGDAPVDTGTLCLAAPQQPPSRPTSLS